MVAQSRQLSASSASDVTIKSSSTSRAYISLYGSPTECSGCPFGSLYAYLPIHTQHHWQPRWLFLSHRAPPFLLTVSPCRPSLCLQNLTDDTSSFRSDIPMYVYFHAIEPVMSAKPLLFRSGTCTNEPRLRSGL